MNVNSPADLRKLVGDFMTEATKREQAIADLLGFAHLVLDIAEDSDEPVEIRLRDVADAARAAIANAAGGVL